MAMRAIATRYAKALLDVADQQSDVNEVARGLASVAAIISGHDDLLRVLTAPGIATSGRVAVARALASRLNLAPPLAKLLVLLAERGRIELLPDIAAVYAERVLAHQNVVPAEVTSAVPLDDEQVRALTRRLSELTGASVRLSVNVDPAIVGGLVTRIGSTVYDGSIQTQLGKVKQQLVETAS